MDEEIKLYQSEDALVKLEVRIACDTVWLTQQQMTQLFQTTKQNISLHIRNIYKEGELDYDSTVKDFLTIQSEGKRKVQRSVIHYNLDVIISIGYRVKSMYGTKFRIWATSILKEYFFGRFDYPRMERLENRVTNVESQVADIIQQTLPPTQGIFFDGQIFDAYQFVSDLIRSAKRSIVLFDNYADDSVLTQLAKRTEGVTATVCASRISESLQLDVRRHNCLLVLLHTIPETFFRSADNGRRFFYICGLLILKYHYYAKIYTFHPPLRSYSWFRPR